MDSELKTALHIWLFAYVLTAIWFYDWLETINHPKNKMVYYNLTTTLIFNFYNIFSKRLVLYI